MTAQDLRDADAAWIDALLTRDEAAASKILHDEYALILVHPQPARVDRDEWLRTLAGYVITSRDIHDLVGYSLLESDGDPTRSRVLGREVGARRGPVAYTGADQPRSR